MALGRKYPSLGGHWVEPANANVYNPQGKAGSQNAKAVFLNTLRTAAPVGAAAPMRASSPKSSSIGTG